MAIFSNADCVKLMYRLGKCSTLSECIDELRETAAPLEGGKRNGWGRSFDDLIDALDMIDRNLISINDYESVLPYRIFVAGNNKLDFVSFSSLPFITCPGMGACGLHGYNDERVNKGFCYSTRAWRIPGGYIRQLQNYLLMRFRRQIISLAFLRLPYDIEIRLYVDGDFASMEDLEFWFGLLQQRPDLLAYGYSKSFLLFLSWHDDGKAFPPNYVLNISNGHSYDETTLASVMALPCVRNQFIGVPVDKRFASKRKGYDRYEDPEYHKAVREAGKKMGIANGFSCPGKCFKCLFKDGRNQHACGAKRDNGTYYMPGPVLIGIH